MTRTKENDSPKCPHEEEDRVQKKHGRRVTSGRKGGRLPPLGVRALGLRAGPVPCCLLTSLPVGDASSRGLEENAGWPSHFCFCEIFTSPLIFAFQHWWRLQGPLRVSASVCSAAARPAQLHTVTVFSVLPVSVGFCFWNGFICFIPILCSICSFLQSPISSLQPSAVGIWFTSLLPGNL